MFVLVTQLREKFQQLHSLTLLYIFLNDRKLIPDNQKDDLKIFSQV